MRNPHGFRAVLTIRIVLGFSIAFTADLARIGGGSLTVSALLLIIGLPAEELVATANVK